MHVKVVAQTLMLAALQLPYTAWAGAGAFDNKEEKQQYGFYAGASLGAYNINPVSGDSNNGGSYGIQLGIEDKSWALEARFFQLRTTEDVADKSSDLMSSISLVYRHPLTYGEYIKLKGGWFNYSDGAIDNSDAGRAWLRVDAGIRQSTGT